MAARKTNLDDIWEDLKGNPALLFVLFILIVVILYYVYKKNNANTAPVTASTTIPAQSPYYLINDIITPGVQGPAGPAGPPGPPGATGVPGTPGSTTTVNELVGKTRAQAANDDNSGGVGVYTAPGGSISRRYPYNSDVTIIGTTSAVNGIDYYPIKGGGYIRERDLIGFG